MKREIVWCGFIRIGVGDLNLDANYQLEARSISSSEIRQNKNLDNNFNDLHDGKSTLIPPS